MHRPCFYFFRMIYMLFFCEEKELKSAAVLVPSSLLFLVISAGRAHERVGGKNFIGSLVFIDLYYKLCVDKVDIYQEIHKKPKF